MNQTLLLPTVEDMRTNATFDALMWALARPGRVQPLPFPGLLALAESLLDRECSFFCSDERLKADIARTGANAVALPQAEYVFASIGDRAEVSAAAGCRTACFTAATGSIVGYGLAGVRRGVT